MFQHTDTSGDTPRAIGPAVPSLPDWLTALGPSEDQIRDTGWAGYPGEGYWPQAITLPDLGPDEVLTGDLASNEPDPVARVWRGVQGKRPLTPDEIAARNPVPETISDRQFAQALAKQGIISQDEALAFVKRGEVPTMLQATIDAVEDPDARFNLDMAVSGATTFDRYNPSTVALAVALTWSPAQMDDLWRFAATIR